MSFNLGDFPTQDPQSGLAYALQNGQPNDPQLANSLLNFESGRVLHFAQVVTSCHPQPNGYTAMDVAVLALQDGLAKPQSAWGFQSPLGWLLGLAARRLKTRHDRRWWTAPNQEPIPDSSWPQLADLPRNALLAGLLFGLFNLTVESISQALNISIEKALHSLDEAQTALHPTPALVSDQGCDLKPAERRKARLHSIYSPEVMDAHVLTCAQCQQAVQFRHEAWKAIRQQLHNSFPAPSDEDLRVFRQRLQTALSTPKSAPRFEFSQLPWRLINTTGLIAAGVAAIFLLLRTPIPADLQFRPPTARPQPTATPMDLPPAVNSGAPYFPDSASTFGGPNMFYSNDPVISSNGEWMAFNSLMYDITPDDDNQFVDIYAMHIPSGKLELISKGVDGTSPQAVSISPAISGDGRLIAFQSEAGDLAGDDLLTSCAPDTVSESVLVGYCWDIYVYDQVSARMRRVTIADEYHQLNGINVSPAISGDGRWLAFWTSSTNFVAGQTDTCPTGRGGRYCLDLALVNLQTGEKQILPVGRTVSHIGTTIGTRPDGLLLPVSFSEDGQYLALTLTESDVLAGEVGLTQDTEAFVYDRISGQYSKLAVALEDGQLLEANGPSLLPVLSADGQVAAFISAATNLDVPDTNESLDVFVLDRSSGEVQRASLSSDGRQTNNDSGILLVNDQNIFDRLSISGDGRYVTFITAAENLLFGQRQESACWEWVGGQVCNLLITYDRLTRQIEQTAAVQGQVAYTTPSLSHDGDLLTYAEFDFNCDGGYPFTVCGDIWLVDRFAGYGFSLTLGKTANQDGEIYQISDERRSSLLDIINEADSAGLFRPTISSGWEQVHARDDVLNSVVFSADGKWLFTASRRGSILHVRADDLRLTNTLYGHSSSVRSLAIWPDGSRMVSAEIEGQVRVWSGRSLDPEGISEASGGRPAPWEWSLESSLTQDDTNGVEALAVSPDGRWLAIGSRDGLSIWLRNDSQFIRVSHHELPGGDVNAVAFNASSEVLAAANGRQVTLIRMPGEDGAVEGGVLRLTGMDTIITSLAFHNQDILAVADRLGRIDLWQIDLEEVLPHARYVFSLNHNGQVYALAFDPNRLILASSANDSTLKLWDAGTGHLISQATFSPSEDLTALSFSPDGRMLVGASTLGNLHKWNLDPVLEFPRMFARQENPDPYNIFLSNTNVDLDILFGAFSGTWGDARDLSNPNTMAPLRLPPGLEFIGTYINSETQVLTTGYTFAPMEEISGVLVLRQGPVSSGILEEAIPMNVLAKPVIIGVRPGELISGGFILQRQSDPIWSDEIPDLHLRWQASGLGFAMDYYAMTDDPGAAHLMVSDLRALANAMRPFLFSQSTPDLPVRIRAYGGETCTQIAQQTGTDLGSLLSLNAEYNMPLTEAECQSLNPGREIWAPVLRRVLTTVDLTCDSEPERIALMPYWNDPTRNFGLIIEGIGRSGLYEVTGRMMPNDEPGHWVTAVDWETALADPRGCGQLIVVTIASEFSSMQSTAIIDWQGDVLLNAPGIMVSDGSLESAEGEFWLVSGIANASTCLATRYIWQNDRYQPAETTTQTGAVCPDL